MNQSMLTRRNALKMLGTGTMGLDPKIEKGLELLSQQLDKLSAEIPLDSPWSAQRAAEFDRMTVEDWLTAQTENEAIRGSFRLVTRSFMSADPMQMSFLLFLFYLRTCDKSDALFGIEGVAPNFLRNAGGGCKT
jgi:monoamine oxidase